MDKITALYCRFAYGDVPEIIEEQKALLLQTACDNGLSNTRFYVDSGVSGLTMDRPAFNELMADMENGLIEAVIAQDASRICRRSSECRSTLRQKSHGHPAGCPRQQQRNQISDLCSDRQNILILKRRKGSCSSGPFLLSFF